MEEFERIREALRWAKSRHRGTDWQNCFDGAIADLTTISNRMTALEAENARFKTNLVSKQMCIYSARIAELEQAVKVRDRALEILRDLFEQDREVDCALAKAREEIEKDGGTAHTTKERDTFTDMIVTLTDEEKPKTIEDGFADVIEDAYDHAVNSKRVRKPCPFCGGGAQHIEEYVLGPRIHVVCEGCGASSGTKKTEEEAWEEWDGREKP